jgi:peptidyl-prolyl cis-trans isomerase A (cyclophilin A)
MLRRLLLTLPLLAALSACTTDRPADPRIYTRVDTELGAFVIAVDPARAPITVANYLALVDGKHLDNGKVYRIVTPANQTPETKHKIEVVQWGRAQDDKEPSPRAPIAHETTAVTGLKHRNGTVSMARVAPGTASGEFFICIGDQPELDFGGGRNPDGQGFAAFGQVVAGEDIVMALYGKAEAQQYIKQPIAVRTVRRLSAQEAAALSLPR